MLSIAKNMKNIESAILPAQILETDRKRFGVKKAAAALHRVGPPSAHGKSFDCWLVDIDSIQIFENLNFRIETEELHAHRRFLTESMKKEGFKHTHPITVMVAKDENDVNQMYLIDGHNRVWAAKSAAAEGASIIEGASIKEVPAIFITADDIKPRDLLVSMINGNKGLEYTRYEMAIGCDRLHNQLGMTHEEIAEHLHISTQSVRDMELLMKAPQKLRELVASNKVTATLAIATIYKHRENAYDVLMGAVTTAATLGKATASAKHVQVDYLAKVVVKSSQSLYSAIDTVRNDPAFDSLSPENRQVITDLLDKIEGDRAKAEKAASTKATLVAKNDPETLKAKAEAKVAALAAKVAANVAAKEAKKADKKPAKGSKAKPVAKGKKAAPVAQEEFVPEGPTKVIVAGEVSPEDFQKALDALP